jgi:hypothetical protein
MSRKILLEVWLDAVQVRLDNQPLGWWFPNEMQATAAALERVLMDSAILPDLRKLPPVTIEANYRDEFAHVKPIAYLPAVRVRYTPTGRRVVRVPGTFGKTWMEQELVVA